MPIDPTHPGNAPPGSRRVRGLVLAIILGCGLLWRLPAAPAEWRFMLCENDSLYQLHRVEGCLSDFPRVPSVDPYSHHPRGYRVHWMPLHTVLYASLAELAGIAPSDRDQLVAVLSWIPPLLGLVALLLVFAIVRACTDDALCLYAVGAACAVSSDVVRPFFYGTIDHHLFAHLGVLLMVWGRLRLRLSGWVLGIVALLGLTPEGIIYVSAFLGCLFAAELMALAYRSRRAVRRPARWLLAPAAVSLLTWWLGRRLETAPLPVGDLVWTYPTLFQPLWFAVLGGATAAALPVFARLRRAQAGVARSAVEIATVCAAVTLVAGLFLLWSGALSSIGVRLLGVDSQRLVVDEEISIFHAGFWQAPAWYRVLAFGSIFVAVKLAAALRAPHDSTYWFQWLALATAFALGFMELRHLYVLSALQLVALGLAVFETARALRALPLFAGRRRLWPAVALGLATLPVLVSGDVLDRAASHGEVCARLPVVEELSTWLKQHTPDPAPTGLPTYAVFGGWSIGHQLHVIGERPVVVDPFNYELDPWVDNALDGVWHAHTAEELVRALRRYGVRYLVLTNPTSEILGSPFPQAEVRREDLVSYGPGGSVTFRPAMSQFASFRLFMSGGLSPEFGQLQLRYVTAAAEHYSSGETRQIAVPRGQIYELKPGALITGVASPSSDPVTVRYRVRRGETPATEIETALALDTEGRFEFRTALPAAQDAESCHIDGAYTLSAGTRSQVVWVTQEMVDSGAVVTVTL
jgi:asparagine N-glycosylation enzyme membrane subunit Stt3